MKQLGQEHPWFREHPRALSQATAYILECLETAYTRRAWSDLGEEMILADAGIQRLFDEYFQDKADCVLKLCCDAHRQAPPVSTFLELLNSPAGLRQLVAAGKLQTLRQVKETNGGTQE